jgi:integrase
MEDNHRQYPSNKPPSLPVKPSGNSIDLPESAITEETIRRSRSTHEEVTSGNTLRARMSDISYIEAWMSVVFRLEVFRLELNLPLRPDFIIRFINDHVYGFERPEHEAALTEDINPETGEPHKKKKGAHRTSTILRRLSTLSSLHEAAGIPIPENPFYNPLVVQAMKDLKKKMLKRPKPALTGDDVLKMIEKCDPNKITGIRDRAILCFGFDSGRRRSEITTATLDRLEKVNGMFVYHLGKTKQDQAGREEKAVVYKGIAAEALRDWLDELSKQGVTEGEIFRRVDKKGRILGKLSDEAIRRMVIKYAFMAGLDDPWQYGAHSLRSGYVTTAQQLDKRIGDMMGVTKHKKVESLIGYYQVQDALKNPAFGVLTEVAEKK